MRVVAARGDDPAASSRSWELPPTSDSGPTTDEPPRTADRPGRGARRRRPPRPRRGPIVHHDQPPAGRATSRIAGPRSGPRGRDPSRTGSHRPPGDDRLERPPRATARRLGGGTTRQPASPPRASRSTAGRRGRTTRSESTRSARRCRRRDRPLGQLLERPQRLGRPHLRDRGDPGPVVLGRGPEQPPTSPAASRPTSGSRAAPDRGGDRVTGVLSQAASRRRARTSRVLQHPETLGPGSRRRRPVVRVHRFSSPERSTPTATSTEAWDVHCPRIQEPWSKPGQGQSGPVKSILDAPKRKDTIHFTLPDLPYAENPRAGDRRRR